MNLSWRVLLACSLLPFQRIRRSGCVSARREMHNGTLEVNKKNDSYGIGDESQSLGMA